MAIRQKENTKKNKKMPSDLLLFNLIQVPHTFWFLVNDWKKQRYANTSKDFRKDAFNDSVLSRVQYS